MSKMSQHVYDLQQEQIFETEILTGQASMAEDQAYQQWADDYNEETQEQRGEDK